MRTEARTDVAVTNGPSYPRSRILLYALLVFGGLTWDLGSKEYVFRTLGCPGRAEWEWRFGDLVRFTLQTNFNHGALWGIGQGFAPVFAGLSIVAATGIIWFLFVHGAARSSWLTVALGFVTAGAMGNLYDRLGLHGWMDRGERVYAVRDFLYFRFLETFDWAIFNYADSFLVTGAIMLVIHSMWMEEPAIAPSQVSPQPSEPQLASNAVK